MNEKNEAMIPGIQDYIRNSIILKYDLNHSLSDVDGVNGDTPNKLYLGIIYSINYNNTYMIPNIKLLGQKLLKSLGNFCGVL